MFNKQINKNQNIFITADNLEALNLLQQTHQNTVDLLYLDPPYNTGKSNYAYKNNFKSDKDWIMYMHHVIKASGPLLKPTASIVFSIDEHMLPYAILLLKSSFPSNRTIPVTLEHNKRGHQSPYIAVSAEYIIFSVPYTAPPFGRKRRQTPLIRNLRKYGHDSDRSENGNTFYPVIVDTQTDEIIQAKEPSESKFHPKSQTIFKKNTSTAEVYPIDISKNEKRWTYAYENFSKIKQNLKAVKTKTGYEIMLTIEDENYKSVWTGPRYDANIHGTKLLNDLIGQQTHFTYPKSLNTMTDIIHAVTANIKDAVILDPFAGSGTTAHAVYEVNQNYNKNNKFILIQTPNDNDHGETAKTALKRLEILKSKYNASMFNTFETDFESIYVV